MTGAGKTPVCLPAGAMATIDCFPVERPWPLLQGTFPVIDAGAFVAAVRIAA